MHTSKLTFAACFCLHPAHRRQNYFFLFSGGFDVCQAWGPRKLGTEKRMDNKTALTKLTPPQQGEIYPCERLYKSLEQACTQPVVWITGAPGAGKTTLVAGWLAARNQRALWYQLDAGDSDPAAFFHYLRIAARPFSVRTVRPRHRDLHLLSPL